MTLHNGLDKWHNRQMGPKTGTPEEFVTFDALFNAYDKQLDAVVPKLARHKMLYYEVAGEEAAYLHMSLLMDDCIARGKALLEGGVRYLNASSEVFGIVSAADSFTAIKKLVYDEKRFSLKELVEMLDSNFEGHGFERNLCLNAPKYGKDNEEADTMMQKIFNHIAQKTIEAGQHTKLNRYNIVSVNNSMSAEWGFYCEASACGRLKGAAMSNGNGPSAGADKNGVTALFNSMSKVDPARHVGVIQNIRFTKEMFNSSFDKIKALLTTFYNNNGVQTNICVIGKDDLENACRNPENYRNLLVRIGGFSARFIELSPVVQKELIDRTTYEA
jgi:pyruvate-formate lyase